MRVRGWKHARRLCGDDDSGSFDRLLCWHTDHCTYTQEHWDRVIANHAAVMSHTQVHDYSLFFVLFFFVLFFFYTVQTSTQEKNHWQCLRQCVLFLHLTMSAWKEFVLVGQKKKKKKVRKNLFMAAEGRAPHTLTFWPLEHLWPTVKGIVCKIKIQKLTLLSPEGGSILPESYGVRIHCQTATFLSICRSTEATLFDLGLQ